MGTKESMNLLIMRLNLALRLESLEESIKNLGKLLL